MSAGQAVSVNETPAAPPAKPAFRLGVVLRVVVPLGAAVAAGLLSWGHFDVEQRIHRWMLPPLVSVSGQVFLNGEPLAKAQVFTQPSGGTSRGAMGVADADGRFSLRTDVDGDFLPGARLGKHLVVIQAQDPNAPSGPFKPPLITPPDCAEFSTTPLTLQVERDPARNQFTFRLEHKAEPPKAKPAFGGKPPAGAKPRSSAKSAAPPPADTPANAADGRAAAK